MKYTDNVRFNHKLNVIFFIGSALFFYAQGINLTLSIKNSLIFTLIYSFSSAFFQPDLDQTVSRPGKDSFPLGKFKNTKAGVKIFPIFYPLNRIWFFLWQPYGYLWTHRGLSHWPIIGTWTRVGYLLVILISVNHFLNFSLLNPSIEFLKLFFPIKDYTINWKMIDAAWVTYVLPIFLADLVHYLVDLFDSIRNNTRFASAAHEPGILRQALNPKIMKYHKKALKKAKSNSKKRARDK